MMEATEPTNTPASGAMAIPAKEPSRPKMRQRLAAFRLMSLATIAAQPARRKGTQNNRNARIYIIGRFCLGAEATCLLSASFWRRTGTEVPVNALPLGS